MENINVMPCPFCGGKSRVHKYFTKYYARCNKCNTYSAPYNTPEEATTAWNKRTHTLGVDLEKTTQIYVCDREMNTECTKSYCVDNGGECECTLDVNFALKDKNGEPLIYVLKRG